jgi:hypothetical protein
MATVAHARAAQPGGRFTLMIWRLWKKNDSLVDSGLIGPVTLTPTEKFVLYLPGETNPLKTTQHNKPSRIATMGQ